MQVKKQQLDQTWEQLTGSKLGKEYNGVYCHHAYLTYMQSSSYEMSRTDKSIKTESRLVVASGQEGNGTPLQYCCLENPMDGGAW